MKLKLIISTVLCSCLAISSYSQGLIQQVKLEQNGNSNSHHVTCGSHDQMLYFNKLAPSYLEDADDMMREMVARSQNRKLNKSSHVSEIQVVFHLVYNKDEANLPDSVVADQIRILNESYRRKNADTNTMRADYKDIVGDAHIEFKLATEDPFGNPTSGITRTKTEIKNFGGILPYGPGQNAEIAKWVSDSLFINFFRISESNKGGHDAWDETRYLNIWVGDFTIFEPQFNNFEELVYFGLATPPAGHKNWPDSLFSMMQDFRQGVLLQYQVLGSNNPAKFKGAYAAYNPLVTTGKMLVHETGHYLGLRHIWGDGDCNHDDYIDDTPRATQASQYNCNKGLNTCKDTINGKDLPNMLENYMDYSSADCQNSFTLGQIALMQTVLEEYRKPLVSVKDINNVGYFVAYPNPNQGVLNFNHKFESINTIEIYDLVGNMVLHSEYQKSLQVHQLKSGVYVLRLKNEKGQVSHSQKLVIQH